MAFPFGNDSRVMQGESIKIIDTELNIKTDSFGLESKNFPPILLTEIVAILSGAERRAPKEAFSFKQPPADKKATASKIDKISKIQSGEDVEVFDLKKLAKDVKLPHATQKFRCPQCDQALLLQCGSMAIVRDIMYGTNKAYSIPVDFSSSPSPLNDNGDVQYDAVVDIYKDCINLVKDREVVSLVSDSEDEACCPICGYTKQIKDFVSHYENSINENMCDICGGTKETNISNNGERLCCIKNDCYSKLNKKND